MVSRCHAGDVDSWAAQRRCLLNHHVDNAGSLACNIFQKDNSLWLCVLESNAVVT
jgi:hypothetical protein